MVNVCLFLRNPSLQVALAGGRHMGGQPGRRRVLLLVYFIFLSPENPSARSYLGQWLLGPILAPGWTCHGKQQCFLCKRQCAGQSRGKASRCRHCQGLGPGGGLAACPLCSMKPLAPGSDLLGCQKHLQEPRSPLWRAEESGSLPWATGWD